MCVACCFDVVLSFLLSYSKYFSGIYDKMQFFFEALLVYDRWKWTVSVYGVWRDLKPRGRFGSDEIYNIYLTRSSQNVFNPKS